MKNIVAIIFTTVVLVLCTCSRESDPDLTIETQGLIGVEVIPQRSMVEEDKMETIRFIVFKNMGSGSPVMELNEKYDIPASGGNGSSKFRVILEVSRKANGPNDKTVVAIINEPATMNSTLNTITGYQELENVELDFAHFLNNDHATLLSEKSLPMTGVLFTDDIYSTPEQAESNITTLEVQRAVARVDVILNKDTYPDTELAPGTTVTLENTYDKEFFIRYENSISSFGKIGTVTSGFIEKTWTLGASGPGEIPEDPDHEEGEMICYFYTPERTCSAPNNADKLILNIQLVCSDGVTRGGVITLDRLRDSESGNLMDIDVISRNNIYKVITTLTENSFTANVLDWTEEEIGTEF